ncbi:MAG: hypothetical protein JXA67_13705 [Micromonosporaceae bacterium]|nr:hypothetical protein [Micromonosporaceae bacterium]
MFVYRLTEPIDLFDGLTPLPNWLASTSACNIRWALQAILALADATPDIGWHGDMRHLPSVGALPTPPETTPFLVVKQDNNGTTFIVTTSSTPWLHERANACTQVEPRPIGAWTHPTTDDIPQLDFMHATGEQPDLNSHEPGF